MAGVKVEDGSCCLENFQLYETQSMFYLIGRNENRSFWKVLKINRLELTELSVDEDIASYSEVECHDLLRRIHEGNKATGGLKFVTNCFGIVGFVKFLGPYYMLIITERRQIGVICGHTIYSITKSELVPVSSSSEQWHMNYSRAENRYKKLLCTVDLTKDFFFSYSYHVMCSLQRNLCDSETRQVLYETMFVWNEFLTREIRKQLSNTLWTVALVYGFFKQAKLSIGSKDFMLTLISRRSRHYAGTRYLKRGLNEDGRVANDVETEQIVFEDVCNGHPSKVTSIVQNRGSIPLFWSQQTSRLSMKPDIILQKKDVNYEATRRHFENLIKRYGQPIIIFNLIKTREKKPRESILRSEFANAIEFINRDLSEENRLKFIHWDLHRLSKSKATKVLTMLGTVAAAALNVTGFLCCQVTPNMKVDGPVDSESLENDISSCPENNGVCLAKVVDVCQVMALHDGAKPEVKCILKSPMFQKGVLRTNCIDCLDRTNVAQYAYGLVALGHQLHALGFIDVPKVDLDAPLADDLMSFYEKMGDTLAHQYGGSAAHNKIFSSRRGQCKAAIQSQEFLRTLQRYYSNAWMDAEKQEGINVFLGNFQPQHNKTVLWEHFQAQGDVLTRNCVKRSLSDGNILHGSNTSVSTESIKGGAHSMSALTENRNITGTGLSGSSPDIPTLKKEGLHSRHSTSSVRQQLFSNGWAETEPLYVTEFEERDALDYSNFLDLDWLISLGNPCLEKNLEKISQTDSPAAISTSESSVNGVSSESTGSVFENVSYSEESDAGDSQMSYDEVQNDQILEGFSESFVHWVNYGEALCH